MKKPVPDSVSAGEGLWPHGFLWLTAAASGAAVMMIEILGARMLAPFFGASHFVWTAQIALTLAALAAGYYAGGLWADRTARLDGFFILMAAAAAWLCLTVWLTAPLAFWALRFPMAVGSFLTSALLFFFPLAVLAMTTPRLLRIVTVRLEGVGGNAGRLTALGTIGSFVGTGIIGYVMVPWVPNSVSMVITAGIVALPPILFCFMGRGRRPQSAIAVGLFVAGACLIGAATANSKPILTSRWQTLFQTESFFGRLQVLQDTENTRRLLLNDLLIQNTYDPQEKKSISLFTYMLHGLARAYHADIQDVLCIGLGVGIVPMQFAGEGARVDVVEINPAVVPIARQYFDCDPSRFRLQIDDARHYLNRVQGQYDVVILDAFLGDAPPSHLMTREALAAMRRVLRPNGVLVVNSFGELPPLGDFFRDSLGKTLENVFAQVRLHATGNGNLFFVASCQPSSMSGWRPASESIHPYCQDQVEEAFGSERSYYADKGIVLSDDFNPVEFYDARSREDLRRRLVLGSL
ncbi:MAG TPA: fused MFS/spermidine synthase [Candidatus Paceibacterota bacterium]|nr:fused MFS/spermidine synthase [Candidatus Paceibacterota bacterium]